MENPKIPINKDMTYIGQTTFRDKNQIFGMKRRDRRQHVYVLGKSGTGKSVLLSNMIVQNIQNGDGVCVVDPHGELVESVLQSIPTDRIKDVIYFNPADTDYHIGFNVIEILDPKYKHLVASGLMGIFTKIWANAWSARMEYILNNTILALLDTPGSTLLGIPRMLVDKEYRKKIIENLKDPVIKAFWIHEYEAWNEKFRNEAIAPIQNKVGQFLSSSIIRNVVGQSMSTINVFDIMNEGKIFLVNVSKGRIGEDNSALLGGMIITKIQLAAMERVRIPEDERKDFYLYVDEFQNFVTDSFASILSEARKYRLNLTVAHQYTAQLVIDGSSAVRDAVFGNVGTMIVFRVGADDALFLEKEFEPEFTPQDIVNLPNYRIYLRLMIDGIGSRPFSAKTLPPIAKNPDTQVEDKVISMSRALYCKSKEVVEQEINDWSGMSIGNIVSTSPISNVEKFPAVCSNCKKETSVPFKPEPGRPIYCKDCIAKIKSGEIKPVPQPAPVKEPEVKKVEEPVKPGILSTLTKVLKPIIPIISSRPVDIARHGSVEPKIFPKVPIASEPPVQKEIPKPFVRSIPMSVKPIENTALRDILNKTLSENKVLEKPVVVPEVKEIKIPVPPPAMSLSDLKRSNPVSATSINNDRSASAEDMNKLKNFIFEKVPAASQEKKVEPVNEEVKKEIPVPTPPKNIKEVPEDVLKKILE
ncbi:MAG: CxxC-x17-CxxC domain-containing protein [Minisyncoccia bacterium]